jgi:hypothetical protein
MNKSKFNALCLALPVITGLALSVVSGEAQSASATISDVAVAGGYDYTIILQNTGTFNLNSFWYGWIQFQNDLPSNPSNAGNSLGWANNLDANSIQWVNSTGTALTPGQSGDFTFFSTSTPAQMTAGIAGESVAYVGSIDFSQGTPGDSTGIFSPTLVATPEPSAIALLAVGSLGLLATGRRKLRTQ